MNALLNNQITLIKECQNVSAIKQLTPMTKLSQTFSTLPPFPASNFTSINKNVCIANKTLIFYAMPVACRLDAKNALIPSILLIAIGSSTNIRLAWRQLQDQRKVVQRKMEKNQRSLINAKYAKLLLSNLNNACNAKLFYVKVVRIKFTQKENL